MATDANTPEHRDHPASATPPQATFGMKRAAEVAGISVSTIRRNKELLRAHGAVISPDGWQVPITALVAAGLMRRQTPPESMHLASQAVESSLNTDAQETIRRLELEALELRHRAELAEERQRSAEQRAQDARELANALTETLEIERRMLTSRPSADSHEGALDQQRPALDPDPQRQTDAPNHALATTRSERPASLWKRLFR